MLHRSFVALSFIVLMAASPSTGAAETGQAEAVAFVSQLEGRATLRAAISAPPERLVLLRFLYRGMQLEAGPGSVVTVTFFNGQRQRFAAGAKVAVHPTRLYAESGQVRELPPVAMTVDVKPLLRHSPRMSTLAPRIRGNGQTADASGREPNDDAAVRRAAAILDFTPLPGVEIYHLVVEDENERAVVQVDTRRPQYRISPRYLRSGISYYWWVEPKVPHRPELRRDGVFRTLDKKEEEAREALAAAVLRATDPDLILLLAAVDHQLGLHREACAELRQATGNALTLAEMPFECPPSKELRP
jgi:hypothetical protein